MRAGGQQQLHKNMLVGLVMFETLQVYDSRFLGLTPYVQIRLIVFSS